VTESADLAVIAAVQARRARMREARIWPNERVLGRPRGIRIGEEPDRDGQYFPYLAMWIFALDRLGAIDSRYRERAIALARAIHPAFVVPGTGVIWKMREDLSGPYPGFGLGALGLVVYRLLDPVGLAREIEEMRALVDGAIARSRSPRISASG
jgi:hypothetical protein